MSPGVTPAKADMLARRPFYEIVMGSLPDMTPGAVPAPLVRVVERRGSGQDRASKLIEFVLHGDPKKRPTAKMVLAHVP